MLMGQGVISNENLPESYLRKAICMSTILILLCVTFTIQLNLYGV